ncbi:hypothetical protein [Rhodopila sp.]|uniref:hypothetical protein n=1 Tax=Rhodopila sp. TaxID=2480087 RepID=UPI003D0E9688
MSPPLNDVVIDHVSNDPRPVDSGLTRLAILMRFHGLAADPSNVAHAASFDEMTLKSMPRSARGFMTMALSPMMSDNTTIRKAMSRRMQSYLLNTK